MPHTDQITGIRGGVDKNGLPTGLHWTGRRTFRDDEGNVLGETSITIPLTKAEIETHIAAGLTARDADIDADKAERAAHAAALAAKTEQLDAATAEISRLKGK